MRPRVAVPLETATESACILSSLPSPFGGASSLWGGVVLRWPSLEGGDWIPLMRRKKEERKKPSPSLSISLDFERGEREEGLNVTASFLNF